MRSEVRLTALLLGLLVACQGAGVRAPQPARPPNVLLILADDLGYQDLGCYGHPSIHTPVLDGLAARGVRLTDFHAGATVCTPSRMALLCGAYPSRVGWTRGVIGHGMTAEEGLDRDAVTLGQLFQDAGYDTALIGKWHLGHTPERRPHRRGFDFTHYLTKSNNQTDQVWRDDEVIEQPFENRRLTAQFTQVASEYLRSRSGAPFFLYLPVTAPHFPVEAHPDWEGRSQHGPYGDVVEELDASLGRLLEVLAEEDLLDDTLVIFCSDNGPEPGEASSCLPYRGEKWSALEGGTRVPAILSWPGVLPEGEVQGALLSAMDLAPTLAHVCALDLERMTHPIDGVDAWDCLRGEGEPPRDELLYWHGWEPLPQALRIGDWKLFFDARHALEGSGTRRATEEQNARLAPARAALQPGLPGTPTLYNLGDDPEETVDRAAGEELRVGAMLLRAAELSADLEPR